MQNIMTAVAGKYSVEKPALVSLSLQKSMDRKLHAVAHNLSNASTTGYKALSVTTQTVNQKGPENISVAYVKIAGIHRDTSDGPIRSTGNPYDFAIQGEGYFKVKTPGGTRYTRSGQFQLNEQGNLVTPAGYNVLNTGGAEIVVTDENRDSLAGTIGLASFESETKVIPIGYGLYETQEKEEVPQNTNILQGALEESNVNAIAQIIDLIELQRLYQNAEQLVENDYDLQSEMINVTPQMT